jgi:hypothetical protein
MKKELRDRQREYPTEWTLYADDDQELPEVEESDPAVWASGPAVEEDSNPLGGHRSRA